jgi:hypothetical protein
MGMNMTPVCNRDPATGRKLPPVVNGYVAVDDDIIGHMDVMSALDLDIAEQAKVICSLGGGMFYNYLSKQKGESEVVRKR